MYSKIQPQQIQLHEFSSPSGHLSFNAGSDFVNVNLMPSITGVFDITGDLTINGSGLTYLTSDNDFIPQDNFVVFGEFGNISGEKNVSLNSDYCSISGSDNFIGNSSYANILSGSDKNTVLAGRNITINTGVNGVFAVKDNYAGTNINVTGSNSFHASFTGGFYFTEGEATFEKSVYITGAKVATESWISGRFVALTGDQTISGSKTFATGVTITGSPAATESWISGMFITLTGNQTISGIKTFNTGVIITGSNAATESWASGKFVGLTGNQGITGIKTFNGSGIFTNTLKASSGFILQSVPIPTYDSDPVGVSGQLSADGDFMYWKNGANWIRFSGVSVW